MKAQVLANLRRRLTHQKLTINALSERSRMAGSDYQLTYRKKGNVLNIRDFVSNGKLNKEKALALKERIIKLAKDNKTNLIVSNSWILYEYPKYAEMFGFKLVKESEKSFERFKKKYDVKKIIGIDINNETLHYIDNRGHEKEYKILKKYSLPRFEIDLTGKIKYD